MYLFGALFGVPFVLADLGIPEGVAEFTIAGVLLLPVIAAVATRGAALRTIDRRLKIVAFAILAVLSLVVGVASLAAGGVTGSVTFFYEAVFLLAVVLAVVRTPGRQGRHRRP